MGEQAKLMAGQLREMEKSREIETKALLLQYRPKIIVRDAKASDFNVADLGEPAHGKVRFTIINSGGSAAHITEGVIALWSAESGVTGPVRIDAGDEHFLEGFTLEPGEDTTIQLQMTAGVTNDLQWANYHAADPTDPHKSIYLIGTIRYKDDLKIPRRTGLMRNYDPKTRTFTPSKTSDEEYSD